MTRSSSGPKGKRSVSDRPGNEARLTTVQHQNVTTRRKRPIVCPYCDSSAVHSSHLMNPIDKALSLLFISPYRCEECRHRFWKIN